MTPAQLLHAVTLLDGRRDMPALTAAFSELGHARLCRLTAPAYYRAKVVECFALLMSETSCRPHGLQAFPTPEEQSHSPTDIHGPQQELYYCSHASKGSSSPRHHD